MPSLSTTGTSASSAARTRKFGFASRSFAALAAVGAVGLAGCSATGSAAGDTETLTFAIANDPLVFNPAANGNGNDTWYVGRQLFESLVYQDPESGDITPWLAKDFEANDDATEFTFTLRDDVTFSDGSPLDAETVQANFDDIKAAGAAATAVSDLSDYAGTEVVDDHTAKVKFSEPNAAFLSAAAGVPLSLISKPSLDIPFDERASGHGVSGTGPFTLGEYVKDDSVKIERRDDYAWEPEPFDNEGAAHVKTVDFKIIPEGGNRTGGLSSTQLDVAGGVAPNDIATVEASNSIVSRANPGTVFGLYFNFDNPQFRDEKVREAVASAIDAKEIRDGALNDNFEVATSPLSQTTRDYADVSDSITSHDVERAKELLDGAGWKEGPDGIRRKDGEPLTFRITYINNFGPNPDSIALVQEQLREVGVDSTQVTGTVPDFQSTLSSGEYELAWRNLSRVDADVLRADFGDGESEFNYPIPDDKLQQALHQQVRDGDKAARGKELADIQRDIVEGSYVIPVHELTTVLGVAPNIDGLKLGADSRLDLLVDTKINA